MANANDPIKRKELYDFLKQNDLVKTDFDTFSAKYAEGDTGQLHSFLKDNNLTTKSQEDFDADYFGDLKKKEDSEPIGQETEEESPIVEETQKDGSSGTVISKRNTINQEIASLNKSYKDANDKSQEAYEAYKEKFDLLSKNWDDQPRQEKSLDFIREEEAKEETTTPEINPTNKNPFIKEENSGVPSVENLNKSEEVEQEKTEFKRDSEKLSSINKQITEVEDKYTSLTNNPDELEAAKNSDGTLNALKNQKQQLENSVGFYNTLFEEVAKDTNSKFSQDGSFLRNLKSVVGAKEDATETVELSDGIKNQLLLDLKGNERLKQKIEQGRASLDEKEELISNAKSKHFQKEYNNLKIEKNRIVDSPSLTKDEKRRQLEGLSENFDFLLGSLGFDEATGNLKETFAKSKELQDFKEDFADDGFFNAVGDNVSTLVGGLVGVSLKAGVGFIGDSMASVGDLFTDKNNYSSFDAFQDTLDRVTDYQFAPNSEAKSKRIVNDKGNLNLNFETASKSLSEVLPFTLFLIGEAKKGKVSGIEKTLGKFINPNKSKGISSKLSMVDGAFRATYSDNLKQAKELGLENFDAMLYSSSMSMAEGVSQLIMPDTKFLNSSTGSAIINTFTKDLKSAVGKKATKQVVGNFFKNILLEVGEEEVVLAAEEIMGTALVVGHDESVLFNSTRQKELVAATVIMSGVMGTAGLRNSRTQEKLSIYKNISGNIDAIKESLNESLNVEGISEVEKTNIKSVIDYAANIDDAIKMSPENVTSEQIDFLTEKNKLVKQKENLDPAFHEGINKKINELVEKINGKSDSMSLLPEESQLKFKDQAAKEIQKEYEDKGVKDYEITDEEITKRANEIIERPEATTENKPKIVEEVFEDRDVDYEDGAGRKAKLNTKDIVLEENGENTFELSENGHKIGHVKYKTDGDTATITLTGIFNPSLEGKGLGSMLYIKSAEALAKKGITLVSDTQRTDQAEKVWNKLESEGKASFDGKVYSYVAKTKTTPQAKTIETVEDKISPTIDLDPKDTRVKKEVVKTTETDYSGEKIQEIQDKIDIIEEAIISKYMKEDGLTEEDAMRKYLLEENDTNSETSALIEQRNKLEDNTISDFSKKLSDKAKEIGLSNEGVDAIKKSLYIDPKTDKLTINDSESISENFSDKKLKGISRGVAMAELEAQGLDYDGVMGVDSGWSESKKKKFAEDIAKKVKAIQQSFFSTNKTESKPNQTKSLSEFNDGDYIVNQNDGKEYEVLSRSEKLGKVKLRPVGTNYQELHDTTKGGFSIKPTKSKPNQISKPTDSKESDKKEGKVKESSQIKAEQVLKQIEDSDENIESIIDAVKGKVFNKIKIKIKDLIEKDQDLRDYLKTNKEKKGRNIEKPIIIGDISRGGPTISNGVIDGFHRIAQAIANGDTEIDAYLEDKATKPNETPKKEAEDAEKFIAKASKKQVPEGKGNWRKAFNEETDAFKKAAILRAIADGSKDKNELKDILESAKGMPEESNIVWEIVNKKESDQANIDKVLSEDYSKNTKLNVKDLIKNRKKLKEAKEDNPKLDSPKKDTKEITQAKEILSRTNSFSQFQGMAYANARQKVIELLTGKKSSKAKSGINAMRQALVDHIDIPESAKTSKASEDAYINSWIKNETTPNSNTKSDGSVQSSTKPSVSKGKDSSTQPSPESGTSKGTTKELAKQSKEVNEILGISKNDADVLSLIYNSTLTSLEKKMLYRQWNRGVMSLRDIEKMTIIDLQKLKEGNIDKWAQIIINRTKGNKIEADDIDFEEIDNKTSAKEAKFTKERINSGKDKADDIVIGKKTLTDILLSASKNNNVVAELFDNVKRTLKSITKVSGIISEKDIVDNEVGGFENVEELIFSTRLAKQVNDNWKKEKIDEIVDDLQNSKGKSKELDDIIDLISDNRYEIYGIENASITSALKQAGINTAKEAKGEVKTVKSGRGEYDVTFNEKGVVSKIVSKSSGKEIKKFVERKVKKTKKNPQGKKIGTNGIYSKIEADATGAITESQAKQEIKAKTLKALDKFNPSDEYGHALEHMARGGKVSLTSAKKETGLSTKEVRWAVGFGDRTKLKSVEAVAEDIVADAVQDDLELDVVRQALIDIISENNSISQLEEAIVDQVDRTENDNQEQELRASLNSLSPSEFAMYEAITAEDSYISELTDEQVVEYYTEKIEEYEQGKQATERQQAREATNQKPKVVSKSVDGKKTSPELQEVDRQIEKAKNDVQKAKTTLQNKAKSLDKSINQDQEDLFGERESQNDNQLFDERVDIDKRDQATAKERQAVKDAEKSLKELQDKKKQLQETGEVTNEIDFKGQKKAKVNPEVTTLENEIDYAESNIENLNEEINNEKSNLKEETTKLREKISEVRKSKISKNSKDDKIEDLKAQIEDLKDETDGVIETYKDDIRIEKSDLKSATKKLAKLKGEGKPKSKLDSFIEGAEKLKKDIDKSGRESLGMNIPQAILSPAISIIIQTAKATKSTIKALEAGLKYIKESDWYKNLSKEDKKEVNKAKIQEMWAAEAKTPEENFEYTEFIAQRDHEALNKKPSRKQRHKNISRNIIEKYSDRQFVAKTLLKLSDMQRTADRMINGHGAAGKAKRMFDKAYEKIYADKVSVKDKSWTYLNKEDRKTLDKIIVLKRFIAIAENRAERGLSTPTNPGFISQKIAQDALDVWENKLGKEKFKDMDTRSKEYFKVYEEILSDMLDNGLISQEAFDVLNGADYQPRLFLQHIIDFDGNVDLHSKKKGNVDNGGLSQDQIKNLDEGSMQPLIRNSEWLLSTTIAGRYKAMATNTTNTKFIKKDLPKAKARYKELQEDIDNKKNWSKEDKQFFEYFTELDSKIVDNPIIGNKFDELSDEKKDRFDELQEFIDEGGILPVDAQKQYDKFMKAKRTPVHLHDKTPNGFSKAYYYENGTRGEFFIEDGLHESWFNNIKGFLSPESKSLISTYSGSSLLKNIATGVNPSFPIVNTPRDWLFTALFSSEYHKSSTIAFLQVAKDAVKAVGQIAKSKESMITKKVDPENLFNKYIEYGGDMQFLSQQGRLLEGSDVSNVINSVFGPRVRNAGGKFFSTITFQKISTYSEMMFRVAIMGRTVNNELKNLGYKDISEVEALEDKEGNVIETKQERIDDIYNRAVAEARTILDFNQGGVITKDMEAFIPYINTAVQGTRVVADAIKKDPAGTISKMLEMGISASLFIATSSLALIAFNRDPDDEEDKDLSVIEILLKTRKGISTYKKIQYFTIPTGRKDKEGEYEYWQIAKTQPMTPVFSLTDNAISTVFSKIAGVDRKDSGVAYNDIGSAINNNIMPIDISFIGALLTDKSLVDGLLSSGSGTITRNPMAKSVLSYKTQYDFYRNQSITYDIDKDDSAMSGAKDKNIEDFYKKFGRANRISPAGIKAAVESFITTPSTNPGIGFMYGGADYISASDKELKSIAGEFSKTFKKSTLKRMQGYTSPYNREINRMAPTKDETQELSRKNKWEEIDLENSVKNVMNGDISLDKFVGDLENYKPEVVKKLGNKIKSLVKYKGLDRYVIGLKFENDKEVRAKKILHFYGDINDPKFKGLDAFKQMIDMNVLDEETFKHYTRMYEEMKEKVKK